MSIDLQELPLVRIHVRGGVVQHVGCPDGIRYEVIDYDDEPGEVEPVKTCCECGGPLTSVGVDLTAADPAPAFRGRCENPACPLNKEQPVPIKERLEYLRGELRGERISYDELHELQSLAAQIDPDDVELLEAAGVPELPPVVPDRSALRTLKVVAACTNASGQPDFAFIQVECTACDYHLGEHYDAARNHFLCDGYEEPFVMFDEEECPGWLLTRFDWQSASCVSTDD